MIERAQVDGESQGNAEPAELLPGCPANTPAIGAWKGKGALLTLDSLDGRTRAARRARSLMEAMEQDLGGVDRLSIGERQIVQRHAVLGALIESMEAGWLAGLGIDVQAYVTALNAQRRCAEAVGIKRKPRDLTPDPLDYARSKAA